MPHKSDGIFSMHKRARRDFTAHRCWHTCAGSVQGDKIYSLVLCKGSSGTCRLGLVCAYATASGSPHGWYIPRGPRCAPCHEVGGPCSKSLVLSSPSPGPQVPCYLKYSLKMCKVMGNERFTPESCKSRCCISSPRQGATDWDARRGGCPSCPRH